MFSSHFLGLLLVVGLVEVAQPSPCTEQQHREMRQEFTQCNHKFIQTYYGQEETIENACNLLAGILTECPKNWRRCNSPQETVNFKVQQLSRLLDYLNNQTSSPKTDDCPIVRKLLSMKTTTDESVFGCDDAKTDLVRQEFQTCATQIAEQIHDEMEDNPDKDAHQLLCQGLRKISHQCPRKLKQCFKHSDIQHMSSWQMTNMKQFFEHLADGKLAPGQTLDDCKFGGGIRRKVAQESAASTNQMEPSQEPATTSNQVEMSQERTSSSNHVDSSREHRQQQQQQQQHYQNQQQQQHQQQQRQQQHQHQQQQQQQYLNQQQYQRHQQQHNQQQQLIQQQQHNQQQQKQHHQQQQLIQQQQHNQQQQQTQQQKPAGEPTPQTRPEEWHLVEGAGVTKSTAQPPVVQQPTTAIQQTAKQQPSTDSPPLTAQKVPTTTTTAAPMSGGGGETETGSLGRKFKLKSSAAPPDNSRLACLVTLSLGLIKQYL